MNIHYFQHVSFEGPAYLSQWAISNGHTLIGTAVFENMSLPDPKTVDCLIVLGGPMNIYEEDEHAWLKSEKEFISAFIKSGKPVIGICLGSQLIASVLGAKVFANHDKEIGWFPIESTDEAKTHPLFSGIRFDQPVFHWHGDTFELPKGAQNLFTSAGCANQAFSYGSNVLAFQFHPEVTRQALDAMIENGRDELVPGRFIQTESEMRSHLTLGEVSNSILDTILDRFLHQYV
ncbi:type 1 glutamine amidotransferase [Flavobacterium sp. MAH-1]|uniref:Type 1 glutamine amidotransferase n=1 Tax=Flavobacterium agri TaxID=2743471 RepID=A0A7Y8Y3L4_9FLAO|nr:type 1 glutamine amidotransferase [Flavobacterium agri]NUY81970.1 type 1 glutamine amidotransferase [Flavobacterium agri]NYA71994.1 type 1 glutamine amidotransferase [Flavobacterium agri]